MSNKTYDILKDIAQIWLPGLATLYAALAAIWGFPYGEQIVSTIVAIDTFLGTVLKIKSVEYHRDDDIPEDIRGELIFEEDGDDGK